MYGLFLEAGLAEQIIAYFSDDGFGFRVSGLQTLYWLSGKSFYVLAAGHAEQNLHAARQTVMDPYIVPTMIKCIG